MGYTGLQTGFSAQPVANLVETDGMQRVIPILEQMARQRGQGATSPLLSLRALESSHGIPISHLPINQQIIQTWIQLTGAAFCQHHSLSLASWRRGEPFALMGGGNAARQTLSLLLQEVLASEPDARGLVILPDTSAIDLYLSEFEQMNQAMSEPLLFAPVGLQKGARDVALADVMFTTPDVLHERLLRYHERTWLPFWEQLRIVLLPDVEHYTGVAAAHLSGLLRRSLRLAPALPLMAATLSEVVGADDGLLEMSAFPWRVIPINDIPRRASHVAVWRAGSERIADTVHLALHYQAQGYRVHITCDALEMMLLQAQLGKQSERISVGPIPHMAQIHLLAGFPGSLAFLRQLLRGAFDQTPLLTVLLLGNRPLENTLARLVAEDESHESASSFVLDMPPPVWRLPPINAYTAALHLICAAYEHPLDEAEVAGWQAEAMVDRLERRNQLVRLPSETSIWKPAPLPGDPYAGFGLRTAGSAMVAVYNERGSAIGTLDAALFDRWGFYGAAMLPGGSGYRVVDRNDEAGTLSLRANSEQRRTFPLRRCNITIREERESRLVRDCTVAWGRVVIEEEIYGYREGKEENKPVDQALVPPLASRWTAPAIWIDLQNALQVVGQFVGWSLASSLPLLVLCQPTDLVPAYDAHHNRLYLIDAQPGGNGLSAWVYENLEDVLPLAYDVALDCRGDTLLEQMARTDMDWLLELLVGQRSPRQAPPLPPAPEPAVSTAKRPPPPPAPERKEPAATRAPVEKQPQQPSGRDAGTEQIKQKEQGEQAEQVPIRTGHTRPPDTPSPTSAPPGRSKKPSQNVGTTRKRSSTKKPPTQPAGTAKPAGTAGPEQKESDPAPQRSEHIPAESLEPALPKDPLPDTNAILARLQKLRQSQDRENQETHGNASRQNQPESSVSFPVEPYFKTGDRVFCRSYGNGVVHTSRIRNGHELLTVEFPNYGTLEVDPSVSYVRRLEESAEPPDEV